MTTPARRHRILRNLRAPGRASLLEATITPDGRLEIHGLDSGNGVAEGDEYSHYQWSWTVEPADLPAALTALDGGGGDPLAVLERWVNEHASDPGMAISAAGVPIQFSSRLAD